MFPTPINYQIVITGYTGDRIRRLADLRKLFPYEQMPDIKRILEGKLIQAYSTKEFIRLVEDLEENFSFIVGAKNTASGPTYRGCVSLVVPEDWMKGMNLLQHQEEELKKVDSRD